MRPPVSSIEATRRPEDEEKQSSIEFTVTGAKASYIGGTRIKVNELYQVVARLEQVEWFKAEQWRSLDIHEKAVALNQAGQVLAEVYRIPAPPLLVQKGEERYAFGAYGDGYVFNPATGQVEGADYQIAMNAQATADYTRLFGDDPAVALETYAHEFRHAYQAEQIRRYQKTQFRHLVDDPIAAQEWQHDYILPEADYEAYHNQPVEKDARNFAAVLVKYFYQ